MEHPIREKRIMGYAIWIAVLSSFLWYGSYVGFTAGGYVHAVTQRANGSTYTPAAEIIWLQYVAMPWSSQSAGSMVGPTGTSRRASPWRMFRHWLTYEPFPVGRRWLTEDLKWGIAGPLVVIFCWMAALIGTPTWLRQEPLRSMHYLRIAVYALSFVVVHRVATMMTFWVTELLLHRSVHGESILFAQTVAFGFTFLFGFVWWFHVCHDYLRLNRPWRVAIVVNLFGFAFPLGIIGMLRTIQAIGRGFY